MAVPQKRNVTKPGSGFKVVWTSLFLTCFKLAIGSEVPITADGVGTLARFSNALPQNAELSPSTVALHNLGVEDDTYEIIKKECMEVPFSMCVGGGKPIVPPAQPKSLVGHWSFDDMVGHDSSGFSNGMKPYPQVGPASGGIGYSAYFNGTNYGYINHIGEFESNDITVTFWLFLLQDYTGTFRYILQKGDSRQFTPTLALWDKNNKLHLKVTTEDGITESLDSTAVMKMHRWTHISIVIQGKLLQMYVNGIMDSQLIAGSSISFNRMPLFIGRGQAHSGTPCFIDELRIHRAALHEHAIQAFADGALGPVGPTFARLGCHNCTQEAAGQACSVFNMHGGYELCTERDMLGGALSVARAQGWLFESKMQFWTNTKGMSKAGPLAGPEWHIGERRLGLCCRKVKHFQ
jgi:hypothetical protein